MNKIVFCGFGKLGKNCLEKLLEKGYEIRFILTHKDLSGNSVDFFAEENSIPIFYNDMRAKNNINELKTITQDDILISINYKFILPNNFFNLFKYSLNIHGSLLPKYRGRTPHVWAIINGEKESGITCHLIDVGIDTGPIIKQKIVSIEQYDTGFSLLQKFETYYPQVLIESLDILKNNDTTMIQNNDNASYFGKREPIMGYINFNDKSKNIINFVRAQSDPYPGAYCYKTDGKKLIIDCIQTSEEYNLIAYNIGIPVKYNDFYYIKCIDGILKVIKNRERS